MGIQKFFDIGFNIKGSICKEADCIHIELYYGDLILSAENLKYLMVNCV